MKYMKIHFFFTETGHEKSKILIIFLNKDISISVADIILRFCILILHIITEGSVSRIFYLGPNFNFMQC